jgi:hypothetical protein
LGSDKYRENLAQAALCPGKDSTAGKIPGENWHLTYCVKKGSRTKLTGYGDWGREIGGETGTWYLGLERAWTVGMRECGKGRRIWEG